MQPYDMTNDDGRWRYFIVMKGMGVAQISKAKALDELAGEIHHSTHYSEYDETDIICILTRREFQSAINRKGAIIRHLDRLWRRDHG
jgi:hypothetical protein